MWDKSSVDKVVLQHRAQVKSLTEFLNQLQFDRERQKRLQRHQCPYCYYIPTRPSPNFSRCLVCDIETLFGDRLCHDCASKHNLCVHCGGSIDMKIHKEDPV